VCAHPQRQALDAAVVAGEGFRGIARRFAVSPDAVERHAARHLPAALARSQAAREDARSETLAAILREHRDRTEVLYGEALAVLIRAKRTRDGELALDAIRTASTALREVRGMLELAAKVADTLYLTREQAERLVALLTEAVRRHVHDPAVREAISEGLRAACCGIVKAA